MARQGFAASALLLALSAAGASAEILVRSELKLSSVAREELVTLARSHARPGGEMALFRAFAADGAEPDLAEMLFGPYAERATSFEFDLVTCARARRGSWSCQKVERRFLWAPPVQVDPEIPEPVAAALIGFALRNVDARTWDGEYALLYPIRLSREPEPDAYRFYFGGAALILSYSGGSAQLVRRDYYIE